MLLKLYQTSNDEFKISLNITFLKRFIKQEKITDILEFIESLDPIIQQLIYENKPKDYRLDIICDLTNLPENHKVIDVYEIIKNYKKKYKYKEEEQTNDKTIEQIKRLQKLLVEYTWNYYGIIDNNSYYLFAHQDNRFPLKAILMPVKLLSQEVKDKFDSLTKYGEFFTSNKVSNEDKENLSYFMLVVDNCPFNEQQLFDSNVSGIPKWLEQSKFTYKPNYNWAQSRNEYTMLKTNNDVEKAIFLS
jgi:hypothetical protein